MSDTTTKRTMTGADIAIMVLRYGPIAFDWIAELADVWTKEMTPEELKTFVVGKRKTYEQYIANEQARRTTVVTP